MELQATLVLAPEHILWILTAAATLFAALVEARRWSNEANTRERTTALEHRMSAEEQRGTARDARIAKLERKAKKRRRSTR